MTSDRTKIRTQQLLVVVVGLAICLTMVGLGLWQARTARTHGAEATRQRAAQPAVPLPAKASGDQVAALYGRQVTLRGQYLPDRQYYVGDRPPFRVLTAFRTSDGAIVPVIRGQVEYGQELPAPPSGEVSQTGLLLPSEKKPEPRGLSAQDLPSPRTYQVRIEALAQSWPAPLLNGYVSLNADESAEQRLGAVEVTLPEGEGSFRNSGYALQWWVFAAFGAVMTVIWARSIGRSGRMRATN